MIIAGSSLLIVEPILELISKLVLINKILIMTHRQFLCCIILILTNKNYEQITVLWANSGGGGQ